MNRDIVAGSWKQIKGMARARWGALTGDHLGVITGRRTQVIGERQKAYGIVHSKPLRSGMKPGYPARALSSNRSARPLFTDSIYISKPLQGKTT
jgi:uncharacterized protein YjbJ (UPF0337 family)